MQQSSTASSEPPDDSAGNLSLPPPLTPEYRAFLRGINAQTRPAEEVLEMYFNLRDGNAQDRGRANDLLGCLFREERGYMKRVRAMAYRWEPAAHGRYDAIDLVASTAEEITKALHRSSGRQVLEKSWNWLCRHSFRRAKEQANLNGKKGYKSISARAVKDAQKQLCDLQSPEPEESASDAYLDGDVVVEDGLAPESLTELDPTDKTDNILKADGFDRHTLASTTALTLLDLTCNTDYASCEWLEHFIADYRTDYVSTIEDPDRRTVAEAIFDDTPTSPDAKLNRPSLLESLELKRDRINELLKQERGRFKGALVRAAEKSPIVGDDFIRLVLQRSRTGEPPWKNTDPSLD